jgi:hypothetical protein
MIRFLQSLMLALWVCGGVVLCETPCAAESPVEAAEPPQANPYPLAEQEGPPKAANPKVRAQAVRELLKEPPAPDLAPAPARRRPREPASAPAPSTKPAASPPPAADLSMGGWIESARDLRLAAEAGEGIAREVSGAVEASTFHLSEMSRQFDPFGFKAAFTTIQQQNETIQRQQATIQRLLEAEIARLRKAAGESSRSAGTEEAFSESTAEPSEATKGAL